MQHRARICGEQDVPGNGFIRGALIDSIDQRRKDAFAGWILRQQSLAAPPFLPRLQSRFEGANKDVAVVGHLVPLTSAVASLSTAAAPAFSGNSGLAFIAVG